ncbi:hypothetical protein [Chlorogloeopsis sp. ULAP01]|uniref:hypothetical protein n=1 Tax=Chlorogloeopsis sp. ULAP01 TaxID=3056483 RepID=UPI0030154D8E
MHKHDVLLGNAARRLRVGTRRQQFMHRHGVSPLEAARRLCVDQSNLYMALQKGQIPTMRMNGRTLLSHGALREYQARKNPRSTYRY